MVLDMHAWLQLVEDWFSTAGYLIIFFGLFFENTLFLGLIAPGLLIVVLAGFYAGRGTLSLAEVLAIASCGTILGDSMSYWMGSHFWRDRISRSRFGWTLARTRKEIESATWRFVLLTHFSGYARLVVPTVAGLVGLSYGRWFALDAVGALAWICTLGLIGYWVGVHQIDLEHALGGARTIEWVFLTIFGLWLVSTALTVNRILQASSTDQHIQ